MARSDNVSGANRRPRLDAARKFDTARGVPFRAYANFRVRGAIIDGIRSLAQLPRPAYERLNGMSAALKVSEGAADDAFTSPATRAMQRLAKRLRAS
jgi:RNA polymerase sigma factor FliA